ncbi:MAG: DUF177 domain-containing protein [Gammaproteobacteria bacterium]|nr:DUF177 domain-containing protein [Gammaproteobacteria bacterium]
MRDRLPDTIDAAFLASSGKGTGREYCGDLSIVGMQRLAASLADTDAPDLQVRLHIGRDAGGVQCLEGEIQGVLHLTCQRCLGRVEFPVQRTFRLALVHSEAEADRLTDGYEPLLLEDERLVVREVVEDELLLALPDFPQHSEAETCTLPEYRDDQETVTVDEKPNPFAALASLKRN